MSRKKLFSRVFKFWYFSYYLFILITKKINKFSYIFYLSCVFNGTSCILNLNFENTGACVSCLYIFFDKKNDRFFFLQNPWKWVVTLNTKMGSYFKYYGLWTSTKSKLHYFERDDIFWFSLIMFFFHLGNRRRTCLCLDAFHPLGHQDLNP